MNTLIKLIESWSSTTGTLHSLDEILAWVAARNEGVRVHVRRSSMAPDGFWFYDQAAGEITNRNRSFFQIRGLQQRRDGRVLHEQPVIIQDEIGYLGIICKEFNGVLHLLIQAKIEPGNINKVQLSPTIQATRSNFLQMHGGGRPAYLDYFLQAGHHEIVVDQIQSEQSSRFLKKRNRNILIRVEDEVETLPSHMWMTVGQLKQLLKVDNLVNMDTRTVLSCIPYYQAAGEGDRLATYFKDQSLYRSLCGARPVSWAGIYHDINNYKMFDDTETRLVPLDALDDWAWQGDEYVCRSEASFKLIFCDIEIEGREVKRWSQPLFEAMGRATFALFTAQIDGRRHFLVRLTPEVGCFDGLELGPTVQLEPVETADRHDAVQLLLQKALETDSRGARDSGCLRVHDVLLSEEGGRFYHEENRNLVIEIDPSRVSQLPPGYLWLDFRTLNQLVQTNNVLNIQLRNLLSLLDS
jgi:dTDP-4-dehydro-6-deoxy-alpha-D-glucopyranose 2,3-dehydratase